VESCVTLSLIDCSFHFIRRHEDSELFESFLSLGVVTKLLHIFSEEDWVEMGFVQCNFFVETFCQFICVVAEVTLHSYVLIVCELCPLQLRL